MFHTVGFFRELNSGHESQVFEGSMHDLICDEPSSDEEKLCSYVGGGHAVVDIMGAEVDIVSKDVYIGGGASILTDGIWVWRKDLSHYLRRYHLRLSGQFVDHVRDVSYTMPEISRERLVDATNYVVKRIFGTS